jgi:hypothetical protein
VALHVDDGSHTRDSFDPDPALPAGVSDMAGKARCRNPEASSIAAIFAPEFRRTTLITTLMFAMSYGAAFGAIQQLPQMVPDCRKFVARLQGSSGRQLNGLCRTQPRISRGPRSWEGLGGGLFSPWLSDLW